MKLIALILFILVCCPINLQSQIHGEWYGAYLVAGTAGRMKLTVYHTTDSSSVSIEDPDGGFREKKLDDFKVTDSSLNFSWKSIQLSYSGSLTQDEIRGTMKQGKLSWEMNFQRSLPEKKIVQRPQTPKEPFPYSSKEILIKNKKIKIGATLTLPANFNDKSPIIVLASGSGAQDRNCSLLGHEFFYVIADYLSRNGVGVLRFDDRGIGKSTGIFNETSLQDFASDVYACVSYLNKHFKKNPVGIAGHSEGGMHALLVSEDHQKKLDFLILLASVGTSGKDVLIEQQYLIPLKEGEGEELAAWNRSVYEGLCAIIDQNNQSKAQELLATFLSTKYAEAPAAYKETSNELNFVFSLSYFLNNTWGREFIRFKAEAYLEKLEIPVLTIIGEEDIQVPGSQNHNAFVTHTANRHPKNRNLLMPGLNHLLQHCSRCDILEYAELDESISEEVLKLLTEWLVNL